MSEKAEDGARAARAAATLAEARAMIGRIRAEQTTSRHRDVSGDEWLAAGIAAAIAEERERQRAALAEIIADLQREFDDAVAGLRAEFEAKLAALDAKLAAVERELRRKMEATILEMQRCLAAGDAIAAEDGPAKVLN